MTFKGLVGNFDNYEELYGVLKYENTRGFEGTAFESSKSRSNYVFMISLARDGKISYDGKLARIAMPDVGLQNGKFYSWAQPGLAIITLPFYKIGSVVNLGQIFTFLFMLTVAILNAWLLYYISTKIFSLKQNISLIISVTFALGTNAWIYALKFLPHHFLVLFILVLFILIWKFKNTEIYKNKYLIGSLVWSIFGLSIFFDYPNIVVLSPLIFYFFLISWKNKIKNSDLKIFFKTSIFLFLFLALLATYNHSVFGDWKQMANTIPSPLDLNKFRTAEELKELHDTKNNIFKIFRLDRMPQGIHIQLTRPETGLFFFSPILILALLGIKLRKKDDLKLEKIVLLLIILVNILLYSSFGDPTGGWVYGPRYLVPTAALLSIFVGISFNYYKSKFYKLLVSFLLIYSIANISAGALTIATIFPGKETFYFGIKNFGYILKNTSSSSLHLLVNNFISLPFYYLTIILVSIFTIFYIFKNK